MAFDKLAFDCICDLQNNKRIKEKRPTTRNIKNWADSIKYEHFNIK